MNLDDVVQNLAEQLDRSLVLYDAELNLVAFSAHDDDVDDVRRTVILSRRGSARAREMIHRAGAHRAHGTVVIPPDEKTGAPARVIFPVRRGDRLVGYIAYIHTGTPDEAAAWSRDALDVAADDLKELLYERELGRKRDLVRVNEQLTRVLSGDADARTEAANVLRGTRMIGASRTFTVLVLTVGPPDGEPSIEDRLALDDCMAELLRKSPSRVAGTVLATHAVAITPRRVNQERIAEHLGGEEFARLRAGVGDPREDLVDVVGSYREALVAARAAWLDKPTYGPVAKWSDLGLDRLLVQLPLDSLTRRDLPPPLQKLLAVDGGPDLVATLESYLDNACDAQATARDLVIHRSTLYYRLDRVREIVDIDLGSGSVRRELHTALRVATLAGLRGAR
ncbi:helix-turn-helix domain-containing protein [Streptomyces sp. SID8352]|uniref:PucR family transcriptional regulator n=1 Tax=Streptomyces sp. SID8352 TaxID=2690338 RepID=UPI001370FCAF|nr:helix-turn-helix domain-containing protein [Streptomyces sp. SID8352]MYU26325.1 PucR family transcriptional regulator [Streptomyces sp. SID8352]